MQMNYITQDLHCKLSGNFQEKCFTYHQIRNIPYVFLTFNVVLLHPENSIFSTWGRSKGYSFVNISKDKYIQCVINKT